MKLDLSKAKQTAQSFYRTRIQGTEKAASPRRKIIIILGPDAAKTDWLIIDPEAGHTDTMVQGQLAQLKTQDEDEVIAVVPAEQVLLTKTAMPRLNRYRLQQALPFALEEQVLDDIDELHFAPGPYPAAIPGSNEPQDLPVAVVKKTLLEHWLQQLQEAGIQPDVMIPDTFLLPVLEQEWQMHLSRNQVSIRTGLYSGFITDTQNLETLLSLRLAEELQKPQTLMIYQDQQVPLNLKTLNLKLESQTVNTRSWLALGAAALEQYPYINLLQAPYLPARKLKIPERNKKAWRLAAYALALWIGIVMVSKLGSWVILSCEHHHMQASVKEIYQSYYPQAKVMLDPKAKLQARLKKALAQSEKSIFFQWLGEVAQYASAVRIQSLSFQNNQLSLELTAASFTSLDDFMSALKDHGLQVKQQSAALNGTQVKAMIIIEGKRA